MQFTQCNSLSNIQTLLLRSVPLTGRSSKLSSIYIEENPLKGQPLNLNNQIEQLTFERQDKRRMVELIGIEPMTPCLQSRCSPS